ncbi:MAG: S-methyl-5'-thioadenosine phosphorylase [Candidatus Nealsonbacteria bacterium]|nr:MAG: S-methyl-5'-thioadenosine phosphorylase [Candidatus Nealsonbacteria bacterium]
MKISIAIIGGSGVYDPRIFKKEKELKVKTPFGFPSAPIEIGNFLGKKVIFLARHGKRHQFPPHRVPYRANIFALKKLGVERIIGICAVGSLKKNYKPGEIVIPDQFIDFTKKREYTFYNKGKTIHVSLANPFCPYLRKLFFKEAKELKIPIHQKGTYLCIEGPRFSTRAESKMFKNFAEIIGMTLIPEAQLARELELCYLSLAMITDYDVWQKKPVNAKEILEIMAKNLDNIKKLLEKSIPKISEKRTCFCPGALKNAEV